MRMRLVALVALCLVAALPAAAAPETGGGPEPYAGRRFHAAHPFLPNPARLGVQLQDMTPELREFLRAPKDRGVLVVRVDEGSPAEKAGLRVGDVIVAAGGAPMRETHELVHAVLSAEKGATLALEVSREGKARTVEAALGGEPPTAAAPMRWMDERLPELRENLERRMRELEQRMQQLEQRLKDLPAARDSLDT